MMLPEVGITLYGGSFGLIVIGIAGIVIAKNLFRILLALVIAEAGANMLLVLAGFRFDAIAPIISRAIISRAMLSGPNTIEQGLQMVDPVPQAMVLTSIVIGVGVQALALGLIMQVYKRYGTLDIRLLSQQLQQEIARNTGIKPHSSKDKPAGRRPLPLTGGLPETEGTSRQSGTQVERHKGVAS